MAIRSGETICCVLMVAAVLIFLISLIWFTWPSLNYVHRVFDEEWEIEGWERNRVRNASLYVFPLRDAILTHLDSDICSKKVLVVIVVCSGTTNFKLRKAIRETWANNSENFNIKVLFLVGKSKDKNINTKVLAESVQTKDMITANFIDTYNNLTLKSIFMLKWMINNCTQVPLLMKSDDDVYINMTNLHKFSSQISKKKLPTLLVCYIERNDTLFRSYLSKWYMPKYIYSDDGYPKYCRGAAYLMSTNVAAKLYHQTLQNQLIHIEDVYITGICAKKINITAVNHPLFEFTKEPSKLPNCSHNFSHLIVISHYTTVNDMYRIHNQSNKC